MLSYDICLESVPVSARHDSGLRTRPAMATGTLSRRGRSACRPPWRARHLNISEADLVSARLPAYLPRHPELPCDMAEPKLLRARFPVYLARLPAVPGTNRKAILHSESYRSRWSCPPQGPLTRPLDYKLLVWLLLFVLLLLLLLVLLLLLSVVLLLLLALSLLLLYVYVCIYIYTYIYVCILARVCSF